jgi:pyruvate formate lyase activating enzyme
LQLGVQYILLMTSDNKGIIFDIARYAIHDGPGIRTTVYMKGCPLNCLWCHNPEGIGQRPQISYLKSRCIGCYACIAACPNGAILKANDNSIRIDFSKCDAYGACAEACNSLALELVGKDMTVSELISAIERDKPFYEESGGGVTFSGGEPFLQPNFLSEVLAECRRKKIHTAVETCGFCDSEIFMLTADKVDLFLFDIKLVDSERHKKFTGVMNKRILENLTNLIEKDYNIIVRFPLIPGINDDEENIDSLGRFLSKMKKIPELHILPFHDLGREKALRFGGEYKMSGKKPPEKEDVEIIADALRKQNIEVRIGG